METFQQFEDLFTEVSVKDMKNKAEKNIFLGSKNVRNMIDAAIDVLEKNDKPTEEDKKKVQGLYARGSKTAGGLLGQINKLESISDSMTLIKSALTKALKQQSNLLKSFK